MSGMYAHDLTRRLDLWSRPENKWPLDAHSAVELDRYLATRRPRNIVECGSGSSTAVLARYAAATGARLTVLEHDAKHASRTIDLLQDYDLGSGVVCAVHTLPLVHWPMPEVGLTDAPWYDGAESVLTPDVDFVLIDGPPERFGGRAATLLALRPFLRSDGAWSAWLDDADREGEQMALRLLWPAIIGELRMRVLPFGKNGAVLLGGNDAVYRPEPAELLPLDASDVALTILTGRRPRALATLLDSLRAEAPGLLETAGVMIMHNGGAAGDDPLTAELINQVAAAKLETSSLYGIGRATSLLERATRQSGRKFWLHLEDDWRLATLDPGWLGQAKLALTAPGVAQVRLRHASEPVLGKHMVTGKPITWGGAETLPMLQSPDAHLTFNPFLTVVGRLTPAFPCSDEGDMQRRAHALNHRKVVQLYPGAFVHTGGSSGGAASLRANGGSK